MKVYIAGPMRGKKRFNFPAFVAAAERLRRQGYEVLSPAEMDLQDGIDPYTLPEHWDWSTLPHNWDFASIQRRDLRAVLEADGLYMLVGWENGLGAQAEHAVAKWAGKGIMYEEDERDSLNVNKLEYTTYQSCTSPVEPVPDDSGTKETNPKDALGSDKLPLHLWPAAATAFGCIGLLNGALKYGRANWRRYGVRASIYADAAERHMKDWMEGNEADPEDGVHNLGAALACLAILVDALCAGKLVDDRNYNGKGWRAARAETEPHVRRLKALHHGAAPKHWTVQDAAPEEA